MQNDFKLDPYHYVADIYSYLMRFINYNDWAEYYFFLSRDYIPSDPAVLELAGGNCRMASLLKEHYKNIIVSDLSLNMLKHCEDESLTRVCCDMEALPFRKNFDLVISAFDSVNYLMTKKSLMNLFRQVHSVLADDGLFSFDISLEKNSLKNLRYMNRSGIYKGIRFVQKSDYDAEKKIHYNNFTFTLPDGTKVVENHKQKIYPLEAVLELLIESGFIVRECFKAFSFDDASNDSERAQFVAFKGKQIC